MLGRYRRCEVDISGGRLEFHELQIVDTGVDRCTVHLDSNSNVIRRQSICRDNDARLLLERVKKSKELEFLNKVINEVYLVLVDLPGCGVSGYLVSTNGAKVIIEESM